jgi:hypothetical protein
MSPTDASGTSDTGIPPLFAGLCDDAAMFPPGNATAEDALPAHARYREAWFAPLVGPFLIGTGHLDAVAGALRHGHDCPDAVLVVPGGPDRLVPALAAARSRGLPVVGVELACAATGTPAQAAQAARAALDRHLPPRAGGVVEVRRASPAEMAAALDVMAGTGYRAKLRTGGTIAEAFPPAAEVAAFITGCADRELPFKCTAGLHQAVRHTDPVTGFEHHGFLNILAATGEALSGASHAALITVLELRDGHELASCLTGMTDRQAARTRTLFTAYGTCSITEPLQDLAALGLITLSDTVMDRR